MLNTVFIKGLAIPVTIGVTEQERATPQIIKFDVDVTVKSPSLDELDQTVDYCMLRQCIIDVVAGTSFKLVESLADHVLTQLQKYFSNSTLHLCITKIPKDIPDADGVGVIVSRSA